VTAAAAPPNVNVEGGTIDPAGRLIGSSNDIATVNDAPRCVMACSLPAGSCSYRCIFVEVSR
jgi:hypothetical protein